MKYTFTAVIVKEDKFYVAHCSELGVTSQALTLGELRLISGSIGAIDRLESVGGGESCVDE